jgi:hypothetical protein
MNLFNRWTAIASYILTITGCAATDGEGSLAGNDTTTDTETASAEAASTEQALNGNFIGCRGTALHVCDEQVDPDYFVNHPKCLRNPVCDGQYWACDVACPTPTATEKPNIMVKAAGATTPSASMMIGYVYTYTIPPGYTSGGFHSNSLSGSSVPADYAWRELGIGVGVNGASTNVARVTCDVNSAWQTRKVNSISVRWNNGTTRTIQCGNSYCSGDDLKIGTGFVATCNFAVR